MTRPPSRSGPASLIGSFSDPSAEELFRETFYRDGRRLRLEAWTAVSVFALIVGGYFAFLAPSAFERATIGPPLLICVVVSICIGFASQLIPLPRCASASLFIIATTLQVVALLVTRVALYRAGYEPMPATYPMALSLVLIVTQLRLAIVAPVIVACSAVITACEVSTIPLGIDERNTVVLACAIAVASLVSVYRVEMTSRRAFAASEQYSRLANTDSLTSISNRRFAEQRLRAALGSPEHEPVSLAILDLDDFKAFNDAHGHPAGDRHLRRVAAALRDAADPDTEFVARHAGEEFTVLFTRTDPATARARTESLRSMIGTVTDSGRHHAPTTASAGVATLAVGPCEPDAAGQRLIRAADDALYRAKATGRNQTVAPAGSVPAPPPSTPPAPLTRRTCTARAARATDAAGSSDLRIRHGRMFFGTQATERQFRADFEHQGRGSRMILAAATLAAFIVTVTIQTWLLTHLTPAQQQIRFVLIGVDVVGLGLALTVARMGPRRFAPHLHVVAMTVLITGLMVQRLIMPVGVEMVPLLAPIAVLVSLALVQIRHELLLPAVAIIGTAMLTAEALVLPIDAEQVIGIGVGMIAVAIIARFAYAMERLQRVDWERTRLLDELSSTDLVTGLPNRRAFTTVLRARIAAGDSVALLLLDVDHLKVYNDRFGHSAGDRFLARMGRALDAASGPDDLAARVGGEEFGVLLAARPGSDGRWEQRARAIRVAVGLPQESLSMPGSTVTASAGLAVHEPASSDDLDDRSVDAAIDALFERADRALYQAKHRGRDRLVVAPAVGDTAEVDTDQFGVARAVDVGSVGAVGAASIAGVAMAAAVAAENRENSELPRAM